MSDPLPATAREVSRVTCAVHHRVTASVVDCLLALGAHTFLEQTGRCVRQRIRPRPWGWPGNSLRFDDAPMDILRVTVPREAAPRVMDALAQAADLSSPGQGSAYVQDLTEYGHLEPPTIAVPDDAPADARPLLRDLTLITAIQSMAGGGDEIARSALRLGAGVPLISLGAGTGIRDRMGLLRVTVPAEKEIVQLAVPSHDARGILRLLVEDGRMDRPGGGFVYLTPVRSGIIDARMRLGPQEHAASIEQIIAAVDDLKAGTAWRRRFAGPDDAATDITLRFLRRQREITFICEEGRSDAVVQAAMAAGAGGATVSAVRRLRAGDAEGGIAARERGVLVVPAAVADAVTAAILNAAAETDGSTCRVQTLEAPLAFAHQRARGGGERASVGNGR